MSYCKGKNIEIARGKALKLLIIEKKPVNVVADRFGVNRSTIWRWHKKWQVQNQHRQLFNENRYKEAPPSIFRLECCKWSIPSLSSAPKQPRSLPDQLVQLVLDVRKQLKLPHQTQSSQNHSKKCKPISPPFIYKTILKSSYLSAKASSIFLLVFSRYFLTK